jgi:hypothetical protein
MSVFWVVALCSEDSHLPVIWSSLLGVWVCASWHLMELKTAKSIWSGLWCAMVVRMLLRAAWVSVSISVVLRSLHFVAVYHQCCTLYSLLHTSVSLIMLDTTIHVPWRAAALLGKMISMCCLAQMILICMSGEYLHQKVKVGCYRYNFPISVMCGPQNYVAYDCLAVEIWKYRIDKSGVLEVRIVPHSFRLGYPCFLTSPNSVQPSYCDVYPQITHLSNLMHILLHSFSFQVLFK